MQERGFGDISGTKVLSHVPSIPYDFLTLNLGGTTTPSIPSLRDPGKSRSCKR